MIHFGLLEISFSSSSRTKHESMSRDESESKVSQESQVRQRHSYRHFVAELAHITAQ